MSNRGRKTKVEAEEQIVSEQQEQSEAGSEMKAESKGKNTRSNSKNAKKPQAKSSGSKQMSKSTGKGKTMPAKGGKKMTGGKGKNMKQTEDEEKKERYFKLIDAKTGRSYGRYTGETPKQAASKGFTKMLQKLKTEGKNPPKQSTTIYLRESTRGSARKVYGYEASRLKLPEPQELVIKDKESGEEKTIVYHYRNKIKKVPVPEQFGGAKASRSSKKNSGSSKKSAAGSKKASGSKSTASTKKSTSASGSKSAGNKKAAPAAGNKKAMKGGNQKAATKKSASPKATSSK